MVQRYRVTIEEGRDRCKTQALLSTPSNGFLHRSSHDANGSDLSAVCTGRACTKLEEVGIRGGGEGARLSELQLGCGGRQKLRKIEPRVGVGCLGEARQGRHGGLNASGTKLSRLLLWGRKAGVWGSPKREGATRRQGQGWPVL